MARWASAGLPEDLLARMRAVAIVTADLPGGQLGAYLGEGDSPSFAAQKSGQSPTRIVIDSDAAGHGWFLDKTPGLGEEFVPGTTPAALQAVSPAAVDRIDLLSVVAHELGHLAGLPDVDLTSSGVMHRSLRTGTRVLPTAESRV